MTKTYTFNKTNKKNTIFTNPFHKPDYSSIIDDIILTDVIKKNNYLFKENNNSKVFLNNIGYGTIDDDFIKAANFLANYKSNKKKYTIIPFTLGKSYKLPNGDYIIFYDDEIQIGFDTYKYSDFADLSFLNGLSANMKKTIINIYTTGSANININLL